jgi:hypothetical protein
MNLQTLTTTLVFLSLAFGFGRADGEDLPNVKKNTSLDSKFIVGSKWKGTVRELKGQEELTTDVLVTVTKREGPQFEGKYAVFSGAFVYAVAGTVERNQVSFKFVKIEKMPTGANNPSAFSLDFSFSKAACKAPIPCNSTAVTPSSLSGSAREAVRLYTINPG